MRNRAAFQTQLALIMEALAKAAVAEISKLVEDGTCVLRLEVSRSHKEIDGLRRKLQQVELELRTAREVAKRDSRSAEVQDEDEFRATRGADKGGTDVAFVEHLSERKSKAQIRDRRPILRFTVKEEHERDEEHVAQILHQAESESSVRRLNNVGSEYVVFERDHQVWSSLTRGNSDVIDDPVCANPTEQCSQSQSVPSPIQHTLGAMEMPGSSLSSYEKDDHVVDGGVVKEEVGGECLYTEESRSEMGDTQQTEPEQPPLSTNDDLTSQPVQQQLEWQIGVSENNMDPVSSSDQNASAPWRSGTGEKRYSCTQCHKSFDRTPDLERHQRIHTGEKPFSCTQCGKQFSLRCNLMTHERIHTGNKPFSCAQCGKRFGKRGNLIAHERVHTGSKPFVCLHCGKRFAEGSNLRVHNRIHTGERPYHCTQCGKNFIQLSALKAHQKIHSRNEILEFRISCE